MMVRYSIFALLVGLMASHAANANDEERMKAALDNAAAIVAQYGNAAGGADLARADGQIDKAWRDLMENYGKGHGLAPKLAIIRARAAAADGDKSRAFQAWETALQLNSGLVAPAELLNMNMEAGNAAAAAGKPKVAEQYYAAARAYAFVRGADANVARQQMRIQELKQIGGSMAWRELRDSLSDLRSFTEAFPMWTAPRLEGLVSEAEIRLAYEPDNDKKREALRQLKTDIELMQKGMSPPTLAVFTRRIRTLYYALEDKFKLEPTSATE